MIKALYVHFPYCDSICPYCDFLKMVGSKERQMEYRLLLIKELNEVKNELQDLETIYLGGGTPTAFLYLEDILKEIKKDVDLRGIKEYTIETTPKEALKYAKIFKEYGINRVSIGVETFSKKIMTYLKREDNDFASVSKIVNELRNNGINNINLDLIYSLPYSSLKTTKADLKAILKIGVEHVSYYDLILEEKTILYHDVKTGKVRLPSEDSSIRMRDEVEKELKEFGYVQYEISNWAKPGFASLHNSAYWELKDYLGVGLGAHSEVNGRRFNNPTNFNTYAQLNAGKQIQDLREPYECDLKKEYFLLGLRMNKGVSLSHFNDLYQISAISAYPAIKTLIKEDLLTIDGDCLSLTIKGRHLGNLVFEEFV